MRWLLALLVLAVLALHQDTWLWNSKAVVGGFLPIGMAYHVGYCIVAALTMWTLVLYLWPEDQDEEDVAVTAPSRSAS